MGVGAKANPGFHPGYEVIMRLVLASNNAKKLKELQVLFAPL